MAPPPSPSGARSETRRTDRTGPTTIQVRVIEYREPKIPPPRPRG